MKIIAISDTHGQHHSLQLPKGDMLIHAGDVSSIGRKEEIVDFLNWFSQQDFKHKIFIVGNHDFFFERATLDEINAIIPDNVIYLNDSGVEIEGLKIWGSPIQPEFNNWAFNRYRGANIQDHWDLIPKDTDILITHGPAYGILDRIIQGQQVGCVDLLHTIKAIQPKYHICGHIHEAYGTTELDNIQFVNASVLYAHYQLVNAPIVLEL